MKRKGFTLIELLAVIIILGILMLIAIPSVTSYINNSRKNTYVSSINEVVKGAIAKVNSGDIDMFDTDTTYYIPISALELENGVMRSPYGEMDEAYVVVTYDGESYDYYFVGKDKEDMGIAEITKSDKITKDSIVEVGAISTNVGIEGKSKIVVFDQDLVPSPSQPAGSHVSGMGGTSSGGNSGGNSSNSNVPVINADPGNCSTNKATFTCTKPRPTSVEPSTKYGMTAYFDPVSSSTCNASNAGSGTCVRWHQIGTSGDNVILLSEESIGDTFWLSDADADNFDYGFDGGPYTLLNYIKNNTSTWTRVPLLNYSYTMSYPTDPNHAAYDEYSEGYYSLTCTNGNCVNHNGETLATGLRARVITGEEYRDIINDAITYESATPAISQSWTSAGGTEYLFDDTDDDIPSYNCIYTFNEITFTGDGYCRMGSFCDDSFRECDNNRDISWLNSEEAWTLTQRNDGAYADAYTYSVSELDVYDMNGYDYWYEIYEPRAVYPVITVPRSLVTFA